LRWTLPLAERRARLVREREAGLPRYGGFALLILARAAIAAFEGEREYGPGAGFGAAFGVVVLAGIPVVLKIRSERREARAAHRELPSEVVIADGGFRHRGKAEPWHAQFDVDQIYLREGEFPTIVYGGQDGWGEIPVPRERTAEAREIVRRLVATILRPS
jgi:hypothetical protein